jgi:Type IV leader peptidase family
VSLPLTVLGGALLGMTAGALLAPFTRRELAASVARSSVAEDASVAASATASQVADSSDVVVTVADADAAEIRVDRGHWLVLTAVSGLLPAYVLARVGWSANALPPLLLLVGLVQLAYCDLTRRLLPKTLVYALTATVVASGVLVATLTQEWQRLLGATVWGLAFFALFFVINLANPRWMAFGDVRLSLVVGFGVAWVSPIALLEVLFVANVLAAVVGVALIAAHRAERGSAVPFGLYLALGTALVLFTWS